MKLHEIKALYNTKVEELKNAVDLTDAVAKEKLKEIEEIKNKIDTAEQIEKLEIANISANGTVVKGNVDNMDKYTVKNLANLITRRATTEDIAVYNAYSGNKESVPADGGYLVPKEQFDKLYEYKRELPNLEKYINVVKVTKPMGSMPMEILSTTTLSKIGEGEDLNVSKEQFTEINYAVSKYGDLMQVTRELFYDNTVNLIDHLERKIAVKSVRTTNKAVIDLLKAIPSPKETTKAKVVGDLLDTYYGIDPLLRVNSVLVTNSNGVALLDKLTDNNGEPLLTRTYSEREVIKFRGIEVVEMSEGELATSGTKIPMFVGSLYNFATKFDLQTLEIATSGDAGFISDTIFLRGIERWTIVKIDEASMKALNVDNK